jgi:hypothetical protein
MQGLLRELAIRDVAGHAENARDPVVPDERRRDDLAGNRRAGFRQEAELEDGRRQAGQDATDACGGARSIVGMDEPDEVLADPLGARPPRDRLEDGIQLSAESVKMTSRAVSTTLR